MDEEAIFAAALECATLERRRAFLKQACAGDAKLEALIEGFLQAHDHPDSFLQAPRGSLVATVDEPVRERPGTVIGPYKLLEQIGEGGMGLVFVAEQQHPVRRRVALKIIKPGMDSRQVVARFEAERQALAMMNHSNIAKVHDGGTTPEGRPYFVMELVKGTPITNYCDQQRLTTCQRLELFLDVCHAVQHAHQKGIIHRDLKPSNVLVEIHDVRPVVKVIDFGIAKATGGQLTDKTIYTQFAQLVGTPLYMSPEQAGLSSLDVDTRSDVYSLGVLLYELLTGTTPFDSETLKKAGYDEMRRIIREDEPPKPSARLSTMQQAHLSTIAEQRGLEPRRLSQQVRGELDWIVMRALEKDRNRRYESASAFAADVQRYLNDEPVQACPPSAGYRLRKFARRNKGWIGAGSTAAVVLVLAVVGLAVSNLLIGHERDQKVEALGQAQEERQTAKDESAVTKAVNDFLLKELLAEAGPDKNPRDKKVTVEEVLGRAAARIAGKFEGQPRVEAAIRQTIGKTYYELGEYPAAQTHLERALELRRRVLGEEHSDTLTSMNDLVELYADQGQLAKAEALAVKTLALRRRVRGEEHQDTLESMHNLAWIYGYQQDWVKAEPLSVKVLEVSLRVLGEEHPYTVFYVNQMARVYERKGQFAKAEPLYVKALELRRRSLGEDSYHTLITKSELGRLYRSQGHLAKAEPLLVEALEGQRRVLGEEHRHTLVTMSDLGLLYKDQGQLAKAESLLVKALEVSRRVLGEDHIETITHMANLASLHTVQRQFTKADALYVKALELSRRAQGEEHPQTLIKYRGLGRLYHAQGHLAKAEPLLVKTLEGQRRVLGEEHPATLVSMNDLARLYIAQGQLAKAESLMVKAVEVSSRVLGEDHIGMIAQISGLGDVYIEQRQFTKAEHLKRECLAIHEKHTPDDWRTSNTRSALGGALLGQNKYAEAEPLLVQGYEGMKEREAKIPEVFKIRLTEAAERLVRLYEATNQPGKARVWREKVAVHTKASEQPKTEEAEPELIPAPREVP